MLGTDWSIFGSASPPVLAAAALAVNIEGETCLRKRGILLTIDEGVDLGVAHLLDSAAHGADQVVVRGGRSAGVLIEAAAAVKVVTENQPGLHQQLQRGVDGGGGHVVATVGKRLAQKLGAEMAAERLRTLEYSESLRCPALLLAAQEGIELLHGGGRRCRFAFH